MSLYDNITLGNVSVTKERCMALADDLGIENGFAPAEWARHDGDGKRQ